MATQTMANMRPPTKYVAPASKTVTPAETISPLVNISLFNYKGIVLPIIRSSQLSRRC